MLAKVLAYLTCAIIWGTTWRAIRVCIAPGQWDPYTALVLRFALASLLLLPFALRAQVRPSRKQWWVLIGAGVLDAMAYTLVYLGEQSVTGGVAAVIYGTQPFVLAGFMGLTRHEKIGQRDLVGAAIALGGVALLFAGQLQLGAAQALGVVLVFGSVVCSTIYSALVKRHASEVPASFATTVFLSVTALSLVPLALLKGRGHWLVSAWQPWVALTYLAVAGSVIAFLLYFWLLARVSMRTISALVFLFPLIALAVDFVAEPGQHFGWRDLGGAAIVLAGLAVALTGPRRQSVVSAEA